MTRPQLWVPPAQHIFVFQGPLHRNIRGIFRQGRNSPRGLLFESYYILQNQQTET